MVMNLMQATYMMGSIGVTIGGHIETDYLEEVLSPCTFIAALVITIHFIHTYNLNTI